MPTSKQFWLSKTWWVNVLAVLAGVLAYCFDIELPADFGLAALGAINMGLRAVTSQPLSWTTDDAPPPAPTAPAVVTTGRPRTRKVA